MASMLTSGLETFFEVKAPPKYISPPWPSLSISQPRAVYLYYLQDIWMFIMLWSLVLIVAVYTVGSLWAAVVFKRYYKVSWAFLFLIIGILTGAVQGFIAGCLIGIIIIGSLASQITKVNSFRFLSLTLGGIVAGLYAAAGFKMSTWIAFVWGSMNALMTLIGSFSSLSTIL